MKRFYKMAEAVSEAGPDEAHWSIRLDGRPVRTPARAPLAVPGEALARAVAAEWAAQGETIDPASMPMSGYTNATIDRVLPDLPGFRAQIAAYAASDLFCYRADDPAELVALQAAEWDPLLDWARARYGIDFDVTAGIMPIDQPEHSRVALTEAVEAIPAWQLAGAAIVAQIGGSLVGTLALLHGAIDAAALHEAVTLDERWQSRLWGEDEEAAARLAARRTELLNAARFCELAAS